MNRSLCMHFRKSCNELSNGMGCIACEQNFKDRLIDLGWTPPPDKPKEIEKISTEVFEYTTVHHCYEHIFLDKVNEMGQEGWEIIYFTKLRPQDNLENYAVLKRKLINAVNEIRRKE